MAKACFECLRLKQLVSQRDDEILRLKFALQNENYKVDSLRFLVE